MRGWAMRARVLWLGAAVVGGCAALSACGSSPPRTAPRTGVPASRPVRTAAVERTGGADSRTVPAVVQARRRAALAARFSASVVELPRREGERVAAGAVLVRLDDRALRAAVSAAEAAARAADTDLTRTEVLLERDASTPREAEESRARAEAARAAVAAAREALAYAVIRAPFEGTVASRAASVGDVVSPGAVLLEIEGASGLELRATVDADVGARLRPGLDLAARVDGQPDALTATVRAVSSSGDPATHRFEVRADLPAAPGLRSGLFARLVVPSSAGAPRLLVPSPALFGRGGLTGVFVVSGGAARLRWVAVGAAEGAATEIRAGVEAGERVALDPSGLVDGAAVSEAAEAR